MKKRGRLFLSILVILTVLVFCACGQISGVGTDAEDAGFSSLAAAGGEAERESAETIAEPEAEKVAAAGQTVTDTPLSEESGQDAEAVISQTEGQTAAEAEHAIGSDNGQPNISASSDSHVHQWVMSIQTIHHEEEGHYEEVMVSNAWDETTRTLHTYCAACNLDYTANGMDEMDQIAHEKQHMLEMQEELIATGICPKTPSGRYTLPVWDGPVIHHEAEYKTAWIVDRYAWDEQVYIYTCAICGAVLK